MNQENMLRTGWDSGRRAKKTAMQEEHTTSSEFQELKQLIQAQQQMLDELSKGKHKANTYQQHMPTNLLAKPALQER